MGSGVFAVFLSSIKSLGAFASRAFRAAVPAKVCIFLTRKRVHSTENQKIEDAETWEIGFSQTPALQIGQLPATQQQRSLPGPKEETALSA
jgi:hypothetical protein